MDLQQRLDRINNWQAFGDFLTNLHTGGTRTRRKPTREEQAAMQDEMIEEAKKGPMNSPY
jgi:hypothetical protein